MDFQFPAINYLFMVAGITACALTVISVNQSKSTLGRLWTAVMVSFAIWAFGEMIANMGTTLAWQLGFQRLVYLGVVCAVTSGCCLPFIMRARNDGLVALCCH